MENTGMMGIEKKMEQLQSIPVDDLLKVGREIFDKILSVKDVNQDTQIRLVGLSGVLNYALDEFVAKGDLSKDLHEKIMMTVATGMQIIADRLNDEALSQEREQMDETIAKGGLVIHLVPPEEGFNANNHTHGLFENYNHPDVQVVLNLEPYKAQSILSKMIEHIQNGGTFLLNRRYSGILPNHDILIKVAVEDRRVVMRAIVPDENGLFPDDEGCDPQYKAQVDTFI